MSGAIIDGLIILLLACALVYGYVISRRVQRLMSILKDLEPLVVEFSNAVDKSEESVDMMRETLEASATRKQVEAEAEAVAHEQAERAQENASPTFASRRVRQSKMPGVQVIRDKKDMVRMFFEATRTDARV